MFSNFERSVNDVRTTTDVTVLLADDTGAFTDTMKVQFHGMMRVEIGEQVRIPTRALFAHSEDALANSTIDEAFVLPWTVTKMESSAETPIGTITMSNDVSRPTFGVLRQTTVDSPFPAVLEADVFQTINLPGVGEVRNRAPIHIAGEAMAVPPFGMTAKHANSALLQDSEGRVRGMIVGDSITLEGPMEG